MQRIAQKDGLYLHANITKRQFDRKLKTYAIILHSFYQLYYIFIQYRNIYFCIVLNQTL